MRQVADESIKKEEVGTKTREETKNEVEILETARKEDEA